MSFEEENIFEHIGKFLIERLGEIKEENNFFVLPDTDDHESAYEYLDVLLEEYSGKTLKEIFSGSFVENDYGRFFLISEEMEMNFSLISSDQALNQLKRDLKLIYGIRDIREKQLRDQGVKEIQDLLDHPIYSYAAKEVLEVLDRGQAMEIMDFLARRFGSYSAPLLLYCAGLFLPEDFLFFDLETMGLFHRAVILFGTGFFHQGKLRILQFLVDNLDGEAAALHEFLQLLNTKKALVSFNGRSFDWNYIRERAAYYFMPQPADMPHFDIYHFAKRLWSDHDSYRLKHLENRILSIERENDVPSDMVPEFYETYLRQKNVGPLVPIVYHNKQDLISSARLFVKMQKDLSDVR